MCHRRGERVSQKIEPLRGQSRPAIIACISNSTRSAFGEIKAIIKSEIQLLGESRVLTNFGIARHLFLQAKSSSVFQNAGKLSRSIGQMPAPSR